MPTSSEIFARVAGLGLDLPAAPVANGGYDLVRVYRGLAWVSGQLPRLGAGGSDLMRGRLAGPADVPLAQAVVRLCLLRALVALHDHLGDLAAIEQLVSIRGFLNADAAFTQHAEVLDAASELARTLFGAGGGHVRSALGAGSLPAGGVAELEIVAGVRDGWTPPPAAR